MVLSRAVPQAVAGQAKDGTETLVQVRPGFGEPCTGHAAPTATHECDDGSGGRFKVGRAYQQGCDTRVISGACDPCLLSVKCLNFQLNRAVPRWRSREEEKYQERVRRRDSP